MSLRDEIKTTEDHKRERVEVPEWGKTLFVRSLSGEERDAFEEGSLVQKGKKREVALRNIRARLVVMATVDGEGNSVFAPGDELWLGKKSAAALDRLFSVAQKLAGISDDDIEELVKNSDPGQSGVSGLS